MFSFRTLIDRIQQREPKEKYLLHEVFGPNESIDDMLNTPTILPCSFDQTIQAWLVRISLWGKLKILHIDPENRKRENVSQSQLIAAIFNDELLRLWGQWGLEELAINKVRMYREHYGIDGKEYTEEFIIEIELKPELRKALGK